MINIRVKIDGDNHYQVEIESGPNGTNIEEAKEAALMVAFLDFAVHPSKINWTDEQMVIIKQKVQEEFDQIMEDRYEP